MQAFFQLCEILPDLQNLHKIIVITVWRMGHRLKHMTEI